MNIALPQRLLVILVLCLLVMPVFAQDAAECVTDYDPETDYFPEKVEIEYADGLSVEYFNNYKVVTVNDPTAPETPLNQYVLVQCGTPVPEAGYEDMPVIEVPVDRVVATSTTYLPYFDQLDVVDTLVGLEAFAYSFASNETVLERIEAGEIASVGGENGLDVEVLLDLDPDLVMASPFDTATIEALTAAEIPVTLNADYLESTPLGRAEWGKFVALFFNAEAAATENFDAVEERYNALTELTADVETRPTVFLGSPFEGTWYMAPGGSYAAQLLEDAGADYLWAEDEGVGTLPLDFEVVFDRAADADYWLNPDQALWTTLADVAATDERFADFATYQNGGIYNNNRRVTEAGGNDYYESGVANPDVVLADLIKILHPDLLPDHELYYYQPLAEAGTE